MRSALGLFYIDIEHEVLRLSSHRLIPHLVRKLSIGEYDEEIEREEEEEYVPLRAEGMATGNLDLQYKLTPLFSALISSYTDPKFLPNGGRLAFGLDHEYGVAGKDKVSFHDDYYKGKDAVLVLTLKAMGLSYQFKAVYQAEYDNRYSHHPEPDDFATARNSNLHLISDDFAGKYAYFFHCFVMGLTQDAALTSRVGALLQASL